MKTTADFCIRCSIDSRIFHTLLFHFVETNVWLVSTQTVSKIQWSFFVMLKGQGRIRYQIRLSPLFQSHQAQLYIERKLLLMRQFWHENWKAFHRALTDFKKRQKLHFCNQNFKNDLSIPDVFVCNIATTPPSRSYHLIQLFKCHKSMPFSKIKNAGYCP